MNNASELPSTEYCWRCDETFEVCCCDEFFLKSKVSVRDLVWYLFKNGYDDLASALAKKFFDQDTILWGEVHNIEGDLDFLREIAEDME